MLFSNLALGIGVPECFSYSQSTYGTQRYVPDKSHISELTDKTYMSLYKITGCVDNQNNLSGLTLTHYSKDEYIDLSTFGSKFGFQCHNKVLQLGEYVKAIQVGYTRSSV